MNELLQNIAKLHTTKLGAQRICRNLALQDADAVAWCRQKIAAPTAEITRTGKNWYIVADGCRITVNAHSYTIITAHRCSSGK